MSDYYYYKKEKKKTKIILRTNFFGLYSWDAFALHTSTVSSESLYLSLSAFAKKKSSQKWKKRVSIFVNMSC